MILRILVLMFALANFLTSVNAQISVQKLIRGRLILDENKGATETAISSISLLCQKANAQTVKYMEPILWGKQNTRSGSDLFWNPTYPGNIVINTPGTYFISYGASSVSISDKSKLITHPFFNGKPMSDISLFHNLQSTDNTQQIISISTILDFSTTGTLTIANLFSNGGNVTCPEKIEGFKEDLTIAFLTMYKLH